MSLVRSLLSFGPRGAMSSIRVSMVRIRVRVRARVRLGYARLGYTMLG